MSGPVGCIGGAGDGAGCFCARARTRHGRLYKVLLMASIIELTSKRKETAAWGLEVSKYIGLWPIQLRGRGSPREWLMRGLGLRAGM